MNLTGHAESPVTMPIADSAIQWLKRAIPTQATRTGINNNMDHSWYSPWLNAAIEEAEQSWKEGGIPIGSVLVDPAAGSGGTIIARGHNLRVQSGDPTAHAEVVCIRNAGRRRDWRRLTLVSTLSPCPMCAGTAILFKIPRVIVGENHTFMGAEDWMIRQHIQIVVADDSRCVSLMERMQREKPELWAEDIGQ